MEDDLPVPSGPWSPSWVLRRPTVAFAAVVRTTDVILIIYPFEGSTMWDKMPPLKSRKNPAVAFFVGCLFGAVGVGVYFESFLDFLVPFVVFIIATILGLGVGALPGWLFAGFWGMMRALDSNSRRGD